MNSFKPFLSGDVKSTVSNLHELIPITGTIVSGTYSDLNIKNYAHGMFQSVYDYPYLSSSANQIFDLTVGFSNDSALSGTSAGHTQIDKKINIYNQMSQVLVGYDVTGSILQFDQDGDISAGGTKMKEVLIISLNRLIYKDEIKKQSFTATFLTGGTPSARSDSLTISDYQGLTAYKTNSPAGEYGLLYTSSSGIGANSAVGHIYYQAGIVVLTASIFASTDFGTPTTSKPSIDASLTGSEISGTCDGIRNRLVNLQFNNTTELNSQIYFCRLGADEFNYSSNPTYVTSSKIVVKNTFRDEPVSYITTVGLYSPDNELLAVAKLSEPLKKTPSNEITLRVRLDY